jgi:hypothetical protein
LYWICRPCKNNRHDLCLKISASRAGSDVKIRCRCSLHLTHESRLHDKSPAQIGKSPRSAVFTMSSGLTATPQKNIKIKKRLTTFALVIALMTGSVAQLAVLLYRGARIIVVSSLSFAGENGFNAWGASFSNKQSQTRCNSHQPCIGTLAKHARLIRISSHVIDSVPARRTSRLCLPPFHLNQMQAHDVYRWSSQSMTAPSALGR